MTSQIRVCHRMWLFMWVRSLTSQHPAAGHNHSRDIFDSHHMYGEHRTAAASPTKFCPFLFIQLQNDITFAQDRLAQYWMHNMLAARMLAHEGWLLATLASRALPHAIRQCHVQCAVSQRRASSSTASTSTGNPPSSSSSSSSSSSEMGNTDQPLRGFSTNRTLTLLHDDASKGAPYLAPFKDLVKERAVQQPLSTEAIEVLASLSPVPTLDRDSGVASVSKVSPFQSYQTTCVVPLHLYFHA